MIRFAIGPGTFLSALIADFLYIREYIQKVYIFVYL